MPNFTLIPCEQRSPEWRLARCGRATGSRASDVTATLKSGGEAASRRDYKLQLVCERLTGQPQESDYVNDDMRRGIALEPEAFSTYEALTGNVVNQTGFLAHNTLMAGCSLDGHVGDFETLVSLKCPRSATHLRYLRCGGLPAEHVAQALHELWITGARAYDFLSYDDRYPDPLRTFYVRVQRDETAIAEYERKALAFLSEVDREVESVRTMANLPATLAACL